MKIFGFLFLGAIISLSVILGGNLIVFIDFQSIVIVFGGVPGIERSQNQLFLEFAEHHAQSHISSTGEVLAKAAKEFPEFTSTIEGLCR